MATVRTNYEEIVDVSRIAVSKDDWVLQKIEEAIKNNPGEDIMDILARVKKMKPFTVKELVDRALEEILSPAVKDLKKIALLIIDVQNDFSGDGTLSVPGAEKDGGYKRKKIFSKNVTIYEKEETPRVIKTKVYTKSKLPNWLWNILTFGWIAMDSYRKKVSYEIIVPKDTIFRSISLNNQ